MSWLIISMYSSSPVYSVKRGARIDANQGKRSYEWKMDTLVRQNKRKQKAKRADSRKRMHRERQRSVSSRHWSRIDFLSLYLGTIDNRFWPRLLFVNFLLSSTVRISILGWVIYIYTWIRTIYSMYRWFMVERIVITVQGILLRLLQGMLHKV